MSLTNDNGRLPPTIILTLVRITIIITTYVVQVDFDEEAASKACANSGSPDHMNRFEFMKFGKVVFDVMMMII